MLFYIASLTNGLLDLEKMLECQPSHPKLLCGNTKLVVEVNIGIDTILVTWTNLLYNRNMII
jgi:hypothetical protein